MAQALTAGTNKNNNSNRVNAGRPSTSSVMSGNAAQKMGTLGHNNLRSGKTVPKNAHGGGDHGSHSKNRQMIQSAKEKQSEANR